MILRNYYNDFDLSEDESSDNEGDETYSYLGERSLDTQAPLVQGQAVEEGDSPSDEEDLHNQLSYFSYAK